MSPLVANESRESADAPQLAKRILLGDPLTSEQADEQLLPKRMALPIFASDALSSVAYAPLELLMILLVGCMSFRSFTPLVAGSVATNTGVGSAAATAHVNPIARSSFAHDGPTFAGMEVFMNPLGRRTQARYPAVAVGEDGAGTQGRGGIAGG